MSTARVSLPDRYRVVRHIANGGMASVWEAHDELLDRAVAVKLLASHLSEDDRARQRFQREARAAAGLSNHPHVVTIYDVGEHDGRTFMVMELLTGGTVSDRLRSGDRIEPECALRWLHEAASALDAAHAANVVHRDVKPGNMLLDRSSRLAIADFGIARLALEDQLTMTGQVLGTAAYISPEQATGEGATAASDRYALAVVAFELLTGERPFQADHFAAQARAHVEDPPPHASEINPALEPKVDDVLDRGLAKDAGDRWASAGEFVAALERALEPPREPTASTRVVGPPPRRTAPPAYATDGDRPPPRRSRSRSGVLLAGVAAAALIAVVAAILLSSGGDEGRQPSNGGDGQAQQQETATATPEATREATPEPTPEETTTPEPTPEATETAQPTGEPDLASAGRLQVQGYNARQAGNYEEALSLSEQAIEACAGSKELNPCGYATYEKGVALNRLGRSEEAIPFLEARLDDYPDNPGEVRAELNDAKKKAGQD